MKYSLPRRLRYPTLQFPACAVLSSQTEVSVEVCMGSTHFTITSVTLETHTKKLLWKENTHQRTGSPVNLCMVLLDSYVEPLNTLKPVP